MAKRTDREIWLEIESIRRLVASAGSGLLEEGLATPSDLPVHQLIKAGHGLDRLAKELRPEDEVPAASLAVN